MTSERTEDEALALILRISVGGSPVVLRTLTLKESDAWLDELGASVASVEVVPDGDSRDMFQALLKASSDAQLAMVVAYDRDGVLGGIEAIRERMTKRELVAAIEAMVTAEDPSGEATARSVAEAYGLPSHMIAAGIGAVTAAATEPRLRLVQSPSGPSASGDSTTAGTSIPDGPASSSSSTGPTRRTASTARRKSAAS